METKTEAGRAALPKTKLDQAALASKHLGGQVSAVFPRHNALDAVDDFRGCAAVILDLAAARSHLAHATAVVDCQVTGGSSPQRERKDEAPALI
jgi:hypothetical protein